MTQEHVLEEFQALEAGSSFISKNSKRLQQEYPDTFIGVENSAIVAASPSFEGVVTQLR